MCPCYHNEKWHKTFPVDLWILCTSSFWTELATLLVVYGDKMWIQNRYQQTAKFHGQRSYNLDSGALLNKLWNMNWLNTFWDYLSVSGYTNSFIFNILNKILFAPCRIYRKTKCFPNNNEGEGGKNKLEANILEFCVQ